jgi:hypothetical protein
MTTQAQIVPASHGAGWLAQGWRLFRVAPLAWLLLVFAYWFLMTLVSVLPLIGVVAASVLVPPFAVGFMAASRAAERGGPIPLGLLFEGFRRRVDVQLTLGGAYLLSLGLLLAATALADGGSLARWMLAGEAPQAEALRSDAFLVALLIAATLYVPVMMGFWFAPVLAAWHGIGAAKALFFSLLACLMNWRAFLAYGLAAALLLIVLPMLTLSALALLMQGGARGSIMSLVFPLVIVLLPTLFASFYASYRDVFGGDSAQPQTLH